MNEEGGGGGYLAKCTWWFVHPLEKVVLEPMQQPPGHQSVRGQGVVQCICVCCVFEYGELAIAIA